MPDEPGFIQVARRGAVNEPDFLSGRPQAQKVRSGTGGHSNGAHFGGQSMDGVSEPQREGHFAGGAASAIGTQQTVTVTAATVANTTMTASAFTYG